MYGGLSYGGAHRQTIRLLCALDKSKFNITYFWCKPNPDLNSTFIWPEMDYSNINLMESHSIRVVEFHTLTRDVAKKFHPWIKTDFFEKYHKIATDIIFSSRAGYPEYPFIKLSEPVIEWNIFGCADSSKNIIHSVCISDWAFNQWKKDSGKKTGEIIYPAVPFPAQVVSMRNKLGIRDDVIVIGFHQRADDHIFGEHSLIAYAKAIAKFKYPTVFIIVGGSDRYKALASELNLSVIFIPVLKEYTEISSFLITLDIFAHSGGAGEAHGTVIQEAMMHSLPVITMRIKGCPDGQVGTLSGNGIVVDNIDEYAKALVALVNNSADRIRIGVSAGIFAKDNYGMENVALKFENIFLESYKKYKNIKFTPSRLIFLDELSSQFLIIQKIRAVLRRLFLIVKRYLL